MIGILEALAENRLNAYDEQFPETEEYKHLKARLDSCVERYANVVGEENRSFLDQFLAIVFEQNRLSARDAFLHGFRFGALATIEAYLNRNKFVAPAKKQNGDSEPGAAESSPVEHFYLKLILHALSEGSILTYSQENPNDERSLQLEKACSIYNKILSSQAQMNNQDFSKIDLEFDEISMELMKMEGHSRYTYGYSLGVLIITEIFQGLEKLIEN